MTSLSSLIKISWKFNEYKSVPFSPGCNFPKELQPLAKVVQVYYCDKRKFLMYHLPSIVWSTTKFSVLKLWEIYGWWWGELHVIMILEGKEFDISLICVLVLCVSFSNDGSNDWWRYRLLQSPHVFLWNPEQLWDSFLSETSAWSHSQLQVREACYF